MNYILETCADSVQSAIEAKKGGANRIELCSNLVIGGTSPGESLFRQVKEQTGLNVRVLLRPRFGDFCYDDYEFRMILDEVRMSTIFMLPVSQSCFLKKCLSVCFPLVDSFILSHFVYYYLEFIQFCTCY